MKLLDLLVVFAGLVLFVRLFRIRGFVEAAFYTFGLWYVLKNFALSGMETSLLFPALALLFASFLSPEPWIAARRPLWIFLASGFVIGTRLDAAAFVLPMLAVAPIAWPQKLRVLLGLAACGAVYAGVNLALFGAPTPVSGSVKSLGGLQLNEIYLASLAHTSVRSIAHMYSPAVPWLAAAFALLLALAARRHVSTPALVPLICAAAVGMLLFGAKLIFGSSWRVWPWYGYPIMIFVLAVIWLVQETIAGKRWVVALMGAFALVLGAGFVANALRPPVLNGFLELNRQFIEAHGGLLDSEIVAMGDRAGSFAYFYDGGVYQTEGLVNSAAYLDVLEKGGEMRDHLCDRGVELFVDYEAPLGDYESRRIEVLRSRLTTFPGPHVTVRKSEEVAAYEDLAIYDNRPEGDYRLYAWRLDCG